MKREKLSVRIRKNKNLAGGKLPQGFRCILNCYRILRGHYALQNGQIGEQGRCLGELQVALFWTFSKAWSDAFVVRRAPFAISDRMPWRTISRTAPNKVRMIRSVATRSCVRNRRCAMCIYLARRINKSFPDFRTGLPIGLSLVRRP